MMSSIVQMINYDFNKISDSLSDPNFSFVSFRSKSLHDNGNRPEIAAMKWRLLYSVIRIHLFRTCFDDSSRILLNNIR